MTTAYNKRPAKRGTVRESNRLSAAFIQWVEPKNAAAKILLTIIGAIPLVALSLFNWVKTKGAVDIGVEETMGLSNLNVFKSLGRMSELINRIAYPPTEMSPLRQADAADFEVWLAGFKSVFLVSAGLLAASLVLLFFSIVFANTKARNPFSYLGFALGAASPIVLYYAVSTINNRADTDGGVLTVTLFPLFVLIASLAGMVYCAKYPVITDARGKRSSPFTRIVTTFVPVKGDGVAEGVRKVIFTTALVSFIYFGSTLGVELLDLARSRMIQKQQDNMAEMEIDLNEDEMVHFKDKDATPRYYLELWKKNNDVIGWVQLGEGDNKTKINYSVLQTDDNKYYLDYDFDKEKSKGGWIFADCRNRFNGFDISDNTILYGHNIMTGDYFAALSNYLRKKEDLSYYKDYPVIKFNTLYEKSEWKIFGAALMNTQEEFGEVFAYWDKHDFIDAEDFNNYIINIMDRSVLFTDVDLEYGDKLLTLSTCYWPIDGVDSRAVVFARKVREGEKKDVDLSKAAYNRQVKRFDKEAQMYGTNWPGYTVWDAEKYLKDYKPNG